MLNARSDFPFLNRHVNGAPVVYLDSAATTQKPKVVVDRIVSLYSDGIANVHRAVNFLAEETTVAFEDARAVVARFIGAHASEVLFMGNATQAINVVCGSLSRGKQLRVIATTQEHHSNLLPWTRDAAVQFVRWSDDGALDLDDLDKKLAAGADLAAFSASSNFLGTIHPVREIVERCHRFGVRVLIDASQSIAHQPFDMQQTGCDFLVFSGHKIYGPSGIGVLYVRDEVLQTMSPLLVGGNMVKEVHADRWIPNDLPHRFEAGTPNIEGVIGLAAAIEYLEGLSWELVGEHESNLVQYAKCHLAGLRGVRTFGPAQGQPCAPIVSFQVKGLDSGAVAKALGSRRNIVVRSGFLCAQPAHDQLKIGPSVRASFGVYNERQEIDGMIDVLQSLVKVV
jgi:cysteine desulfurase/selenocysteine lyase